MLHFLVTFNDNSSVRAKSIEISKNNFSFEIYTDKNELLLMHQKYIKKIVPTMRSWKVLKEIGFKKAEVV